MPSSEAYALLTSVIQPRPIAFVSTVSLSGVANLAPFSFFMAGGSNPPSVCYSPVLNSRGEEKDSLRNVRETGEFVVNTVDRPMALGMNETSAALAPHESEWELADFTPLASELVRPARVQESPAHLECRVFEIVEHGSGPTAARYVIGEVLCLHLRIGEYSTIARMGGPHYIDAGTGEQFSLKRPG
ncbi:flavin reductase family protein [bacterium]|nr:MAG: flavin reductase family protein [bacterium]